MESNHITSSLLELAT